MFFWCSISGLWIIQHLDYWDRVRGHHASVNLAPRLLLHLANSTLPRSPPEGWTPIQLQLTRLREPTKAEHLHRCCGPSSASHVVTLAAMRLEAVTDTVTDAAIRARGTRALAAVLRLHSIPLAYFSSGGKVFCSIACVCERVCVCARARPRVNRSDPRSERLQVDFPSNRMIARVTICTHPNAHRPVRTSRMLNTLWGHRTV